MSFFGEERKKSSAPNSCIVEPGTFVPPLCKFVRSCESAGLWLFGFFFFF